MFPTISGKISQPSAASYKSSPYQGTASSKAGSSSSLMPTPTNNTTSKVNGHAIMLSRLFHTDDLNANPAVLSSFTTDTLSGNSYSFLTMGDRKLMEKAYEYSAQNGIDLEQVDNLAFDLANYRFLQVTGNNTGEITGIYDSDGNPWVGKFNEGQAAQAKRILTNPAIDTTSLDPNFLATLLNPQISGLSHAVSFDALEKFIPALSSLDSSQIANNEKTPTLPVNEALRQALYRIDHPYQGAKWELNTPPDSAQNQAWQSLGKEGQKLIMGAYLVVLKYGSDHAKNLLERMSTLTGMPGLKQDVSEPEDADIKKYKSLIQNTGLLFETKA